MQSPTENVSRFSSAGRVMLAVVRELVRSPRFWIVQLAFLATLLWWRFALPWPHSHAADHAHADDHAWEFDPGWPCYVAFLWLLWSVFPQRGERREHPLSLAGASSVGLGVWSALRTFVEALLCFAIASSIQIGLHTILAGFHVEPMHLLASLVFVVAACCAILLSKLCSEHGSIRIWIALPLIAIPEYFRQGHAAEELGVMPLAAGTLLVQLGLLVLRDSVWRTHALRHSR